MNDWCQHQSFTEDTFGERFRGQDKSYIGNKKRNAVIFFMIIMFLQLQGRILRKEKSSVKA